MDRIRELIQKYKNSEVVKYILIGVLTTAVDYAVFTLVNEILKRNGMPVSRSSSLATVFAWVAAVLFAYFTNKFFVFQNRDVRPGHVIIEMLSFFGARLFSGLAVLFFMWILVDRFSMNEYLAKILTSVFNLVFNYAASKLVIFRKQ